MTATDTKTRYKILGTSPIRHDGWDKVTGRAVYGADFKLPGMLHGRLLRSPVAHAIIRSIDTSLAEGLPGVRAVITAADMPEPLTRDDRLGTLSGSPCIPFSNVLAREKVLYKGHAVAAVAATTPEIAEEALSLIKVDYELLPPVMRGRDAMRADAPLLHPELKTLTLAGRGADGARTAGDKASNVASHYQVVHGDVAQGFEDADVVIEREFDIGNVHQGYIELHNATALWGADGNLTIWCSSQGSFRARDQVATVLRQPPSRIKVVPLEIGGGFGGKVAAYIEPVAAMLSKKSGRPVRVLMNRTEIFEGTGPAASAYVKVKMGATNDGILTAVQLTLVYDAGAYPGSPVGAGMNSLNPYRIENVLVDGYDVVVNKPKVAPYRAPGGPQTAFGTESVIDELAQRLNMDPIDFRLLNAVRPGDRTAEGVPFGQIGFVETLEAARDHPHYSVPLGPNQGRGVAAGWWHVGTGPSSCVINVNIDGTVSLVEGSVDIGGSRPAIAMMAAEVLGITAEEVHPSVVDTDAIGWTSATVGSSTAYKTGWAAHDAAQDVILQMRRRAARIWETEPDDVEYVDGVFRSRGAPGKHFTFKELSARLNATGGPICGQAALMPRGGGDAFAVQLVDVEVDPETGKVQVLRCTAVEDIGQAGHRAYVEGQIQGAMAQGIGWALSEEYDFDESGTMRNASFLDYRMPVAPDLPMIDTVLLEFPSPNHPFGIKGVGELPIVPPMPAVANAVARAAGIRPQVAPMSPTRILADILSKNGKV
jgi:CO/xanthine dehydrogenase Mo-binding subunit